LFIFLHNTPVKIQHGPLKPASPKPGDRVKPPQKAQKALMALFWGKKASLDFGMPFGLTET